MLAIFMSIIPGKNASIILQGLATPNCSVCVRSKDCFVPPISGLQSLNQILYDSKQKLLIMISWKWGILVCDLNSLFFPLPFLNSHKNDQCTYINLSCHSIVWQLKIFLPLRTRCVVKRHERKWLPTLINVCKMLPVNSSIFSCSVF